MFRGSFTFLALLVCETLAHAADPRTRVSIVDEAFHINEQPT